MLTPPRSPIAGPLARDYDSAQIIGGKDHQEDSSIVIEAKNYSMTLEDGSVADDLICEMSQIILMDALLEIQKTTDVSHLGSGSTFCAAVLDSKKEKVTIVNLGDSRAILLVRDSVTGKHITISLSEDHNISSPRVKREVARNITVSGAAGRGLEDDNIDMIGPSDLVGYIGKDTVISNKKTIPDVKTFNINEVINKALASTEGYVEGRYIPVNIMVTSDGILERLKSDYNIIYETGEDGIELNGGYNFVEDRSANKSISQIYDENRVINAAKILQIAKIMGARDNMSAIILSCDKTIAARNLAGIVCDGHGGTHFTKHNTSAFILDSLSKRADLVEDILDPKLCPVKPSADRVERAASSSLKPEIEGVFSSIFNFK